MKEFASCSQKDKLPTKDSWFSSTIFLSTGEIADLFAAEDKDGIVNNISPAVKGEGIIDSKDNCWNFFLGKSQKEPSHGSYASRLLVTLSDRGPGNSPLLSIAPSLIGSTHGQKWALPLRRKKVLGRY